MQRTVQCTTWLLQTTSENLNSNCDAAWWWRILRLLWFQLGEERGQRENGCAFMLTECQQMAIARYDVIRSGCDGAFENTVVRFILQEMQGRSRT